MHHQCTQYLCNIHACSVNIQFIHNFFQAPAKPSPANRRSMLKRASTPPLGTSSAKKTRTLVKSMESPNKRDMFNVSRILELLIVFLSPTLW